MSIAKRVNRNIKAGFFMSNYCCTFVHKSDCATYAVGELHCFRLGKFDVKLMLQFNPKVAEIFS